MTETKVTSLDVARVAGVSQSAVSRVFTPGASVSKGMEAKVKKAAESLGYRPNSLARAMITGKSRIIGLVVAYLDNQFYPVALERLSHALQERGYHILIFMAGNTHEAVAKVVDDLLAYQVDGIITASVDMSGSLAAQCSAAGIPVVLFNRGQPGAGLSSVTSANLEGGAKVARFLAQGPHERIAHIAGWQGSSTGFDRTQGFLTGLRAQERPEPTVIDGMYDRETAAQATRSLMEGSAPPDAIFVGNDHMAFAVMDMLKTMGLSVPGDVSIVGYDDVPMASWAAYDLTTVRQPVNRMIEATVETLLSQLNDPDRHIQKIEIDGPLILRGSARLAKDAPS